MSANFFVFGAGYSGRRIARRALAAGAHAAGTTRAADKARDLEAEGIDALLFDGESVSDQLADALSRTTHLVVSIQPDEAGDPVLAAARDILDSGMPALRWIGYLSTVGVYGDAGGAWVDEESECRPDNARVRVRVAVEKAWTDFAAARDVPAAVLRLAGIYGPGRNTFVNLAAGRARRIVKKGQFFNRIRVEDIAGAALHLGQAAASGIFNIAEDEPAPPQDVVAYAAALMGVEPPPEIPFEEAQMTPVARSFYGACRRVSNARLKQAGYELRFANYRASLDQLWQSGDWRGAV